jgi:hypothetical protein
VSRGADAARPDRHGDLEEVVTEAWLAGAPPKLAAAEAQRLQARD